MLSYFLIDAGTQYHLDDIHGGLVSDPHALDKFTLYCQTVEQLSYLGPAAMDDDRIHTHQFHKHHVPRE